MARILADLPDDDIRWLDDSAAAQNRSRAALVREAVASYRARAEPSRDLSWLEAGYGAWEDRTDIGDAVEWQRRERASWTRPWDEDYESVRAQYPDLFNAEDDRQRHVYLAIPAGETVQAKPGHDT